MSTTNTGGPAFPRPFSVDDADPDISYPAHMGMSLRDYFAAKAMQATIASWIAKDEYPNTDLEVAENAYAVANAMLKAREQ